MTPVGHAAFSYVVGRTASRWLPISVAGTVIGGVLPDVDFVLVWAPQFNEWHRVITHNLLVCAVVAVLAAGWGQRRGGPRQALALGLGMAIGGLGHLLTDSTMDTNASNGVGVAWLWPWTDAAYSPFNLMSLVPLPDNAAGWNDLRGASRAVLAGVVWELPWWIVAAWWWRRDRADLDRAQQTAAAEPREPG